MVTSSKPIELVEATSAAVRAARRSREAVSEAARNASTSASRGTMVLEELVLPVSVVRALARILDELAEGRDVAVVGNGDGSDEVTTSQAAGLLGMSRPTLINMLARGEIRFRMVGSHRRLSLADVLAYRSRTDPAVPAVPTREERLRGLREMAESTDRLGLGY
jgi:excisionase family DNA binding protein